MDGTPGQVRFRSSDGLYKRAAAPQHSPAKRFCEPNYPVSVWKTPLPIWHT